MAKFRRARPTIRVRTRQVSSGVLSENVKEQQGFDHASYLCQFDATNRDTRPQLARLVLTTQFIQLEKEADLKCTGDSLFAELAVSGT